MADLYQLRNPKNLHRAWRWIRSSTDAICKSHFRLLYQHFAVAEDALLDDLADWLKRDIYDLKSACKLYQPKASGILRPISLLSVEDQIVYQAAVNLIAEKLRPRIVRSYKKQVFGRLSLLSFAVVNTPIDADGETGRSQDHGAHSKRVESVFPEFATRHGVARSAAYQNSGWEVVWFVGARWPRASLSGRDHTDFTEVDMEEVVIWTLTWLSPRLSALFDPLGYLPLRYLQSLWRRATLYLEFSVPVFVPINVECGRVKH